MGSLKSERGRLRRAVVVGAGRSGLSATLELADHNVPVLLMSQSPSFEANSARDREGFNASQGRHGDSVARHAEDTLRAGARLAPAAAVEQLAQGAPAVLAWLVSLGVPFARRTGGSLALCQLRGSTEARTAHSHATTGRHIVSVLDALVRAHQSTAATDEFGVSVPGEKLVRRLDYWRFVSPILDDTGAVVGVLAQDCRTLAFKGFPADGVIVATGDYAGLFDGAAANLSTTGAALGACYRQGAVLTNLEFVQHHPLVAVNGTASIALPELLRAQGARLLRPKNGSSANSLDLTGLDAAPLARWIESLGPTVGKLLGVDLTREPVEVRSRALRGLGGLWSDHDPDAKPGSCSPRLQATSLSGMYAAGAASALYHGAGCLPGNLAPADIFSGQQAARGVVGFRGSIDKSAFDLPKSVFDKPANTGESELEACLKRESGKDTETPHRLLAALRRELARLCGPTRDADGLEELTDSLNQLRSRARRVAVGGPSANWNQSAMLAASLDDMVNLARAVASAASWREESRGTHTRADFDDSNDEFAKPSLVGADSHVNPEAIEGFDYQCAGRRLTITR